MNTTLAECCHEIDRLGAENELLARRQRVGQRLLNESYNASGRDINATVWPTEADIDAAIADDDAVDARIDLGDGAKTALDRKLKRQGKTGDQP